MIEESITPEHDEEEVEQEQQPEQTANSLPEVEHEAVAPAQDTKWYVLRVVSGKERKVKEYLDIEVRRSDWGSMIAQIFLPVEKVYKVLAGKKVMREKNFYPGYIMIEAIDGKMSDDVIQAIRNVSGVIHFLGKDKPIALRKAEVNKMLGKVDEMSDNGLTMSEPFIVGETIKIIDGPFNDFNGVIEEVIEDKKKLKVTVKIFGRATPVELNFMQVEKIS
jgi:transcriptional antiterminator NusG